MQPNRDPDQHVMHSPDLSRVFCVQASLTLPHVTLSDTGTPLVYPGPPITCAYWHGLFFSFTF